MRLAASWAASTVLLCAATTSAAAEPVTGNCGFPPGDIYAKEFQCDRYNGFYDLPQPIPAGDPGDVIRSEPQRLVYEPSGQLGGWVASGTRIMYRSTDARGNPMAVTGTYFEPDRPWPGRGPRPLIAFAPGTQGQGDQCAPSRLFSQSIHFSSGLDITLGYEQMFVATLVARGFAVVVTDYEGLGTETDHTYVNRMTQGHAVLDAARAAQRLPNTSLDPHGPVAFYGYSQGGGASASAVELASRYAPELDIVGAYAGAPPADLSLLAPFLDGSALVGALGYVLNGVIQAYPETEAPIRKSLTVQGADLLARTKDQCVSETLMTFAFHRISEYFVADPVLLLAQEPFKTLLDAQRIGTLEPAAPVLIVHNRWDPLVPYGGGRQLALDWCGRGADVEFLTNEQPPFLNKLMINHGLAMWVDGERAMQWVADRFNGVPTTPNCGRF